MRAPTGCISSSPSESEEESEEEGERDLGRVRPSTLGQRCQDTAVLFRLTMTVARRLGDALATSPGPF